MVTPSLPQRGRQPKGEGLLTPMSGWIFLHAAKVRSITMLHGASPDEAVSAPWPHRYPVQVPSFSFLKSMISTEQIFLRYRDFFIGFRLHSSRGYTVIF
jgi:hypothetical protein